MKILGIIPARGGSKGVPRKNIKLLEGKPLLAYTSEIALQSSLIDKIILSTEDEEIYQVGRSLGLETPFYRPEKYATDSASSLSVIQHAVKHMESMGQTYDAVCLLQVSSPFRSLSFLEKAITSFIRSGADSLVSVREVPHEYNPHWVFESNDNGLLQIATGEEQIITRRQELPKAYVRDGSIYITKTKVIMEENSLYGDSISYIESSKDIPHVNIDTMEDWKKAESFLKK